MRVVTFKRQTQVCKWDNKCNLEHQEVTVIPRRPRAKKVATLATPAQTLSERDKATVANSWSERVLQTVSQQFTRHAKLRATEQSSTHLMLKLAHEVTSAVNSAAALRRHPVTNCSVLLPLPLQPCMPSPAASAAVLVRTEQSVLLVARHPSSQHCQPS